MISRQIAILIDGGFFLKRLPKLVKPTRCETPRAVTACIRMLCHHHIKALTGDDEKLWRNHIYRIFFYDAHPYEGQAHHPLLNRGLNFGQSNLAYFKRELFECLREQRNVALRLGEVVRESDWALTSNSARKSLKTKSWFDSIDFENLDDEGRLHLTEKQQAEARRLSAFWGEIGDNNVRLGLRQKGVDMRIGLDIASIALKKQASTIVLVAGDSDFVPAAKLARREGVQFILDPLWQKVKPDLFEHIDGLQSGLPNPNKSRKQFSNKAQDDAGYGSEENAQQ